MKDGGWERGIYELANERREGEKSDDEGNM